MVIQIVHDHDNNGGGHNTDQDATNLSIIGRRADHVPALLRILLRFVMQTARAWSKCAEFSTRLARLERLQGEGVGSGKVLQIIEAA